MKIFFIITLLGLLGANVFCQSKKTPVESIYKHRVTKFLVKQDSLIKEYDNPLIEVSRLYITINKAFFDNKTKELQLMGRVCLTDDTLTCLGIPGVGIFKAIRNKNNILSSRTKLAESSYDKASLEKNGFFNFKLKIKQGESLFFFIPHFYLEEFKLGELLQDKAVISKKRFKKKSYSSSVVQR